MNQSKILQNLISDFNYREAVGKEKYNTTVDRTDFTQEQWMQHLKEELMDALMYIGALQEKKKYILVADNRVVAVLDDLEFAISTGKKLVSDVCKVSVTPVNFFGIVEPSVIIEK